MLAIGRRAGVFSAAAIAVVVSAAVILAAAPAQMESFFAPADHLPASEPPAYEWTETQPLLVGRASPAAIALGDGSILVAGGLTATGATASTEILDLSLGLWRPGPTMSSKRVGHTATLLKDGTVLVTGGDTGTGATASAEILDISSSGSFALMSMSFKRSGHAAALLGDGKVLVTGGTDWVSGVWSMSEVYDPVQHKWTATGSMTNPRVSFSLNVLPDGSVLAVGGDQSATSEKYSPTSGAWSGVAAMNAKRYGSGAAPLADGRILVAGGAVNDVPIKSAEVYDPVANSWSAVPNMGVARARFSLVSISPGMLLAAGSFSQSATTPSSEMFSSSNSTWWPAPSMTRSRGAHGYAVLSNGTALVIGGWSGSAVTSTVEAFGRIPGPAPKYCQPIDLLPLVEAATELPGQSGNGLAAKLYAAQARYDNQSFDVCANVMDAFMNQVEALLKSGHMTLEHAAEIYDAYASVMQCIGAVPHPPAPGIGP